ncbi:FK506-binding protein 5-like [Mytilus californianus]|uniref:FK506-binding protein 5-like n=1 Tax=Mytilus californianus TaxID=6549 RepID=UPI0022456EAD|nr:FK506-binding protein 5-like [Mytilus californianus]
MDNWMKIQMTQMTDELKAEIRNGNIELKALFNSFKADKLKAEVTKGNMELKAEVTKGNMELRAMITDLIDANTKSESSGQKDSTQRADTTSDEDEDSQYMHYQGNTKHEHSEDDDDDEDSSDHRDVHDDEAKDDRIDNDDVEIEKEQKQTDGSDTMIVKGEKWFTPRRTPSQPSSSKSKLKPKANTKGESSRQKDSTQRADTTSDEDEDSQYMHYQGNTKHELSEDDDDDEDSSDHRDVHDEEAKDDKIDTDDVEIEKEQKQTDGSDTVCFEEQVREKVIEMLCVEPINVTPSSKHTFSPKQNSPPEPILPAQGKPKRKSLTQVFEELQKSHKLQKFQEKEQSNTSKPIVPQTKHSLRKTEKKKSVKEDTMIVKGEKWFTPRRTPSQTSSLKSNFKPKGHFTDEQSKYIIKYNNNCNPTWSSADFVMRNLKMAGEHLYIWMEDEFSVQQLKDKVKNLKRAEEKKERRSVISPKC